MRNSLPARPWTNEAGILNLDDIDGPGTHWTAYRKIGKKVIYFDSFGNIPPPKELIDYLTNCRIKYVRDSFQNFGQSNCGPLCIKFLKKCPSF